MTPPAHSLPLVASSPFHLLDVAYHWLQRSRKEDGGQRVQRYLGLNAEALNRSQVTAALYAHVDHEEAERTEVSREANRPDSNMATVSNHL